jgi:hypothetical protein
VQATRPLSGADFTQADFAAESKLAGDFDPETPMVGETAGAKGFSMGTAATSSRPAGALESLADAKLTGGMDFSGDRASPSRAEAKGGFSPTRGGGSGFPDSPGGETKASDFAPVGQGAAFDAFVRSEGASVYKEFVATRGALKEVRMKMKACTVQVNTAKRDIDHYNGEINERKTIRIETLQKSGLKPNETEVSSHPYTYAHPRARTHTHTHTHAHI